MIGKEKGLYLGCRSYSFKGDTGEQVSGGFVSVAFEENPGEGRHGLRVEEAKASLEIVRQCAKMSPLTEVIVEQELRPGQKSARVLSVRFAPAELKAAS